MIKNNRNNITKKTLTFKLANLLLVGVIFTGCTAVSPATTTKTVTTTPVTSAQTDTVQIEGLILTNGTVLVTKETGTLKLLNDLVAVQLPDNKPLYAPGAMVEFTIKSTIAESYPPQAQAIASRLISETSPVIVVPTPLVTNLKFHLGDASILIDVRTPEEFKSGYIPDAINIPLDQLKEEIPKVVKDLNKTLLIYCRSGNRSAAAAKELKALGYRVVLDLGGIIDFKEELVK